MREHEDGTLDRDGAVLWRRARAALRSSGWAEGPAAGSQEWELQATDYVEGGLAKAERDRFEAKLATDEAALEHWLAVRLAVDEVGQAASVEVPGAVRRNAVALVPGAEEVAAGEFRDLPATAVAAIAEAGLGARARQWLAGSLLGPALPLRAAVMVAVLAAGYLGYHVEQRRNVETVAEHHLGDVMIDEFRAIFSAP